MEIWGGGGGGVGHSFLSPLKGRATKKKGGGGHKKLSHCDHKGML